MEQTKPSQSLPDNAYRELKPGEEYVPMMPADAKPKEVTPYSVTMGLLMAVLFSAAAAYLGLRLLEGAPADKVRVCVRRHDTFCRKL